MVHHHDIVVIGASAGGVEALSQLVADLPGELQAALFVVLHFPAKGTSVLPEILERKGRLSASHAEDREPIRCGHIFVAPPGCHMLVGRGVVRVTKGPRENGFRPAVDPLFRSAASSYDSRVIGVVLSGMLGDGSAGVQSIKQAGGITMVQDPMEAVFAQMPMNAAQRVQIDYILPVAGIAAILPRLTREPAHHVTAPMTNEMEREIEFVKADVDRFEAGQDPNHPSLVTCPDCGGVLWEMEQGQLFRYRCHVGHAFSGESLILRQSEELENALWSAVRVLEERAALLKRMAAKAHGQGSTFSSHSFADQASEAEHNADVIRDILANGKQPRLPQPD